MRTLGFLIALLAGSTAVAQGGEALPEVPPPPPPPSSPPAAEASPTVAATECAPACRTGYLCMEGQCVSACNPPCAASERCTANGECLAQAPVFPAGEAPITTASAVADPDAERHDGFMLRMALTFGASRTTESFVTDTAGSTEFVYSGFSVAFSLDLGGAPIEDLVIHARFAGFVNPDPNLSQNGDELGELSGLSLSANLFGVGVSYYFMPINVYVTGVVGPSWLSLSPDDGDEDEGISTDVGVGFNLDVGKEWWVSDNWGLGVAGRFWLTTLEHDSDLVAGVGVSAVDYTFLGFGVSFSATYQ
jgi:hypothetical protein